jgi:LPXTG-motif cell wall-anchored protein
LPPPVGRAEWSAQKGTPPRLRRCGGTNPGTGPETDLGTDPGTNPGTDPGTDLGTDPGTNPTTGPGVDLGASGGGSDGNGLGGTDGTDRVGQRGANGATDSGDWDSIAGRDGTVRIVQANAAAVRYTGPSSVVGLTGIGDQRRKVTGSLTPGQARHTGASAILLPLLAAGIGVLLLSILLLRRRRN